MRFLPAGCVLPSSGWCGPFLAICPLTNCFFCGTESWDTTLWRLLPVWAAALSWLCRNSLDISYFFKSIIFSLSQTSFPLFPFSYPTCHPLCVSCSHTPPPAHKPCPPVLAAAVFAFRAENLMEVTSLASAEVRLSHSSVCVSETLILVFSLFPLIYKTVDRRVVSNSHPVFCMHIQKGWMDTKRSARLNNNK